MLWESLSLWLEGIGVQEEVDNGHEFDDEERQVAKKIS